MNRVPHPCPCALCRERVGILTFREVYQSPNGNDAQPGDTVEERPFEGRVKRNVNSTGL